jgi:hypothetical protein
VKVPKRVARARDLPTLGPRLAAIAECVAAASELTHRDTAIMCATHLAENTPIDVGTARSNWATRSGSPFSVTRKAYRPYQSRWGAPRGTGGAFGERGNVEGVTQQARAAMSRHGDGVPVIVSNNLPYIGALDSGRSPQASAGFVHRSVLQTTPEISEVFVRHLRRLL